MTANKGQILIVDDNPTNLDVLFDYLDDAGYSVLVAEDGIDALEQIKYSQPDIVLLDIMMPGIDGYETCRRLKADSRTKDIPVIFVTALSETEDKIKGFQAGAVDYVTKPFHQEEVMARINTHLTIRRLQRRLEVAKNLSQQRVSQRASDLAQANADLEAEISKRRSAYDGLRRINTAYRRFVPQEFLRLLKQNSIVDVQLGDHVQMDMTIFFADIRSFTTISEQMTPRENFNFINTYFSLIGPVIRQHGGFIDKYIGDAIMALFPGRADDAVQASIAILKRLSKYNQSWQEAGGFAIKIGIGLHTGRVMLGTVGEAERMEGTVISDAVNLASRVESLTKEYQSMLILSEGTYRELQDPSQYNTRFLGHVQVKGKSNEVSVFEVFDGASEMTISMNRKTKSEFEEGLSFYYDNNFATAKDYFERVLRINPSDTAASLYLKRAKENLL
ncbi:response regulator [Anaerolineales bacterium HSG6]|nr:response regulator [Anaerolineales bacterium HSG6]MDM8531026.1 response regulator [Anaerolineales bacterium HSG25]